jgi:hypothetical protein
MTNQGEQLHQKIRRFRFSRVAALGISGLAIVAIGGGTAGVASASTTPIGVTLSASSDGASATCSSHVDFVLTLGTDSGSTFAEVDLTGVAGTAVPAPPGPSFVTNNYSAGSPRWVIELANGHSLWGYPPNAGLNGSDFAWAVDNGNTYTSYASAYAAADGSSTTVTDAFIVADGDQTAGTSDDLSSVQYDGQTVGCREATPTPTATRTSASPTPTPTPFSSRTSAFPVGGVETGGGKPATSPWLPFGLGAVGLALLTVAGAVVMRRRQQG